MPTLPLSPAIVAIETDATFGIAQVATSQGALGGVYSWGPIGEAVLVDSEDYYSKRFLGPSNFNAETWFTGADFLSYTNSLLVSRAGDYTGNTIAVSYTGNATASAIEKDSSTLLVNDSAQLSVGMVLFSTNASGVLPSTVDSGSPAKISAIVNSTAVTLDTAASANATSIAFIFRDDAVFSAVAQETKDETIDWDNQTVRNDAQYERVDGLFDDTVLYVARYAGSPGNSLRVAQCDTAAQFTSSANLVANTQVNATATFVKATVGSNVVQVVITPANTANADHVTYANTLIGSVKDSIQVRDLIQTGNNKVGLQFLKVTSIDNVTNTGNVFTLKIHVDDQFKKGSNVSTTDFRRFWEFYNAVGTAPATSTYQIQSGNAGVADEMHVVVVDEDGAFSGSPGTVLETYKAVSRASDAKMVDGGTNFYKDVINQRSQYVWVANPRSTAPVATAKFLAASTGTAPLTMDMYGGSSGPDEANVSVGVLAAAYDLFASEEELPDVSFVIQGKARGEPVSGYTQLGNYIIDNICEPRGDCVALISPDKAASVNNPNQETDDTVAIRRNYRYSSYGIMDSGYKKRYDKYNDLYRWTPMGGDIAGLMARTDQTNDAWWSPAGYRRGRIKNVTQLAFNPRQAFRDVLYSNDINPIITQNGAGTLLFGDKTMLGQVSDFSRINVRRLFIVLKKAIKLSARAMMFEFNDDYTRSAFRNMVNPYLKDVQGRRGIEDYIVICDTSNNGPQVRMNNQFVATIGVKPNHSINWIILNFVAVRTDVSFSEQFSTTKPVS